MKYIVLAFIILINYSINSHAAEIDERKIDLYYANGVGEQYGQNMTLYIWSTWIENMFAYRSLQDKEMLM